MAGKITEMTALSGAIVATDEIEMVDDPAGTPLTRKVAYSKIKTFTSPAASATVAGISELATVAELDTGTDTGRTITPDVLAASDFGVDYFQVTAFEYTTDTAVGDGAAFLEIPAAMNGMDLVEARATVITAGTTNTTDIQIHNLTQTADMLSTVITIASGATQAADGVIDAANDDVATGDVIRIDVDAVSTTAAKGLVVTIGFRKP